jgi:hypothetical protein
MKTNAHSSKRVALAWLALLYAILLPFTAYSLSRPITNDIEFPKNYDAGKAAAIRKVLQDERFPCLGGTVSYWPPDWGTRLSYEGTVEKLNEFMGELRKLSGISLRVLMYRGRNDEVRRDSAWQLDYSHARPNQLTVYLNLNSPKLDFDKLTLPEWSAQ